MRTGPQAHTHISIVSELLGHPLFLGERLAFFVSVREVPGSDLGPETGRPVSAPSQLIIHYSYYHLTPYNLGYCQRRYVNYI